MIRQAEGGYTAKFPEGGPPVGATGRSPLQQQARRTAEELLAGNQRALARAISIVEDGEAEPEAVELLSLLYPRTGRAHVVGITGAPGTGKSTLVDALARAYRSQGRTVGIVAVDPTSPFSGGALLGDRLRMADLAGDSGVFIRSMATRGNVGGLARATAAVIGCLDAAGFERILVETVGAGQAEVDIASAAHTTVVVEAPGMGDEVQALKAGILEIADLFAVNKADRADVDRTVSALETMQATGRSALQPGAQPDGFWLPPITKTVATCGDGVEMLRDWIEAHAHYLGQTGGRERHEKARAARILDQILASRLMAAFLARVGTEALAEAVDAISQRKLDPYTAAEALLKDPEAAHPGPFAGPRSPTRG